MRSVWGIAAAWVLAAAFSTGAGAVDEGLIAAGRPAPVLSVYGFFDDAGARVPAAGVVPYVLNTPLFTDYALKERFVFVPKGEAATYDAVDAFDFPVGSALIKSFGYPADFRTDEPNFPLLETRVLLRAADGWKGFAYVWNAEQTEAELKVAGAKIDLDFVDANGTARAVRYLVPNVNQCKGCHISGKDMSPIGTKARHINRSYGYKDGAENQIELWSRLGLLAGAPPPADAPRNAAFDDPADGTLAERARAYLDINCGHCHAPEGPANTTGLYLSSLETDMSKVGLWKRPVAAGRGSGGLDFAIAPGDPARSILLYRMESNDPGVMMPEVGRSLAHDEGTALIREWIAQMKRK